MTLRAVLIGLALGLFISAFTLFHDNVIRGTWFISNHLPVSVFGIVLLMLLTLNPLLRRFGAAWPLRADEVAVITAIGLASCGWPSFGYFQGFIPITATPEHWNDSRPAWQANQVMSYVPGGSQELGYAHVRDWQGLSKALTVAADSEAPSVAAQVWRLLPGHEQILVRQLAGEGRPDERAVAALLSALNRIIREEVLVPPASLDTAGAPASVSELLEAQSVRRLSPDESACLNRWLLVQGLPTHFVPPPDGQQLLLSGSAEATAARLQIIQGYDAGGGSILTRIPWATWWPVIRFWGGLALVLGTASLCLALVVHPQWSRHEMLPYPIARFFAEISERDTDRSLPSVVYTRLFWLGLVAVVVIHTINGLGVWFPPLAILQIPLQLDLRALRDLFPMASRVPSSTQIFLITISPSVIGFAFLLSVRVSFSVGVAPFLFAAVGGAMISRNVAIEQPYLGTGNGNLMRFGAYLGMAAIIAYVGRRYYAQVLMKTIGVGAGVNVPQYAIWAGRGLVLSFVAAVLILRSGGLEWVWAGLFVLLTLLMFLVVSRIVCETGLFFVQAWWLPVAAITAMFGVEAIGPTSYIVLAIASVIMVGDPRCALMPYLSTALQIVDRSSPAVAVSRVGLPLLVMLLLGFLVAGLATFAVVHDHGVMQFDNWTTTFLPTMPFDELSKHLTDTRSELATTGGGEGGALGSLSQFRPEPDAYAWIAIGCTLVGLCALARLRLPWWPIHPVIFLIWGTMPASRLGPSFLIGWLIKLALSHGAGARGYRAAMPLVVGVIAGELLSALGWTLAGVVYYTSTGLSPAVYRVFP